MFVECVLPWCDLGSRCVRSGARARWFSEGVNPGLTGPSERLEEPAVGGLASDTWNGGILSQRRGAEKARSGETDLRLRVPSASIASRLETVRVLPSPEGAAAISELPVGSRKMQNFFSDTVTRGIKVDHDRDVGGLEHHLRDPNPWRRASAASARRTFRVRCAIAGAGLPGAGGYG